MRSTTRIVAALAAGAALLAGCGSSTTSTTVLPGVGHDATFASAPCPTPNFVPQLNLGPQFTCGFLTVPENRQTSGGRKIRIAVAEAKSTSPHPNPDPLVWLVGGPGGSGLAVAPTVVKAGIAADRNIIFVDQRGTGHSDPLLGCPEVDAFLVQAAGLAPTDPATGAKDIAATKACHDRLAAAGYDLSSYNTSENAADLADLRTALGIKQWNLYSVSYGVDLALQLVHDYPQGIRSMILDSVQPPQGNIAKQGWPNAAMGYRATFDACAAQPACNTAFPNLQSEFTATVNRLTQHPLTVTVPDPSTGQSTNVVFDGYTLANLPVALSLSPTSGPPLVPALVHHLAAGDGTLAATALLGTVTASSQLPGLTGYGLTYGVFCAEAVPFTNPGQAQTAGARALPSLPPQVLSLVAQIPRLFGDCAAWNVRPASPAVLAPVHSNLPALLLTGTLDAVTPPAQAKLAAQTLPNSRVVQIPGLGHGVRGTSPCVNAVMGSFLDQPTGYDTSCVEKLTVPPFQTGP